MNIRRQPAIWTLLSVLAAMPILLQAGSRDTDNDAAVLVDCDHRYVSQRDATRVLDTDNFSQTYAKRQALYANLARLCHGRSVNILLVTQPPRRERRINTMAVR